MIVSFCTYYKNIMIFKCPRCGYDTEKTSNFKKHVYLKKLCEPTLSNATIEDLQKELFKHKQDNTFECIICNKKFSSKITLTTHQKTQHKDNNSITIINNSNITNNNTNSNNTNSNNIISNNTNITNNNITNNITNNINQITNIFLHEDKSYISKELYMKYAKNAIQGNGVIDMIKNIRFNPEHPENMNVRVHRLKNKTLYVFKNNRWEICDANWTLEEMILDGAKILRQEILLDIDEDKFEDPDGFEFRLLYWINQIISKSSKEDIKLYNVLSKRLYAVILNNNLLLMEQI